MPPSKVHDDGTAATPAVTVTLSQALGHTPPLVERLIVPLGHNKSTTPPTSTVITGSGLSARPDCPPCGSVVKTK